MKASREIASRAAYRMGYQGITSCCSWFLPTHCPAAESNVMPGWQNPGLTSRHWPLAGSTSRQPTSDRCEQRYDPGTLTHTVPGSHGGPPAGVRPEHSLTSEEKQHTDVLT